MANIVKKIGTAGGPSRDYSTIQGWEDALPANLVTDGNSQEGQCYNDGEFSVAGTTTFSGSTTSATFYILLTTAAGQSFRDNANVQTNPLAYDSTKGVALKTTAGYSVGITVSEDFVSITNMQVRAAGGGTTGSAIESTTALTANSTAAMLKNNILESNVGTNGRVVKWGGGQMINNVLIQRGTAELGIRTDGNAITILNNTIVRTSNNAKSNTGIQVAYCAATIKNNAIFNFTNDVTTSSGGTATNTTNYTDATTPSSGFTAATMANQFVTTTDTSRDFRLKAGADCIDTGTTDSRASPDIAGTTRPSGSAYDVGAWELVATSSTLTPSVSDSSAVTDTATIEEIDLINVSDSSAVSDAITPEIISYVNVTDTTVVDDRPFDYDDSIIVIDTPTIVIVAGNPVLSVTDSTTVGESVNVVLISYVNVTDSSAVTDTITVSPTSYVNVSDSTAIGEVVTLTVSSPLINVTDVASIGELVTIQLSSTTTNGYSFAIIID